MGTQRYRRNRCRTVGPHSDVPRCRHPTGVLAPLRERKALGPVLAAVADADAAPPGAVLSGLGTMMPKNGFCSWFLMPPISAAQTSGRTCCFCAGVNV